MSLPRNQYTRTKTGIVIGSACIYTRTPEIDEHSTVIQQVLLKQYSNPKHAKWLNRLYVALVIGIFIAAFWFGTPTVPVE